MLTKITSPQIFISYCQRCKLFSERKLKSVGKNYKLPIEVCFSHEKVYPTAFFSCDQVEDDFMLLIEEGGDVQSGIKVNGDISEMIGKLRQYLKKSVMRATRRALFY